jgi:hypothetical protein
MKRQVTSEPNLPDQTTRVDSEANKKYPTEGAMFDIEKGPDHHLIEVDKKDLKKVRGPAVNVHEMKLDAVTITFLSFLLLGILVIVVPFVQDLRLWE